MLNTRYTAWDGAGRASLDAGAVFDRLSPQLLESESVQDALDWLFRRGIQSQDVRVAGKNEIWREVRERLERLALEVHFRSAFGSVWNELRDIFDQPEKTGAGSFQSAARLSDAVEIALGKPSPTLGSLDRLRFWDELPNIRELESFVQRAGHLFQGSRGLDYREALLVAREVELLWSIEKALEGHRLDSLDFDHLRGVIAPSLWRKVSELNHVIAVLKESGYVISKEGELRLGPKGIRRIGEIALRDIFQKLGRSAIGEHATSRSGAGEPVAGLTKRYQHGDPLNLDLGQTLRNAVLRSPNLPIRLDPSDFEVLCSERFARASTVLALDMSWSMSWEGRFSAAKKIALALEALIRTRYPRDYLGIVGFFTRAVEIKAEELAEANWNMDDPFTNLQDGLRLASDLLDRNRSERAQIIVITDGQPTAYFSQGRLHCEWPVAFGGTSPRAIGETLKEVGRLTRKGIVINTFMLDENPSLRRFVDRLTVMNRGRAFYTRPDQLGEYLLVDYISQKRKKI